LVSDYVWTEHVYHDGSPRYVLKSEPDLGDTVVFRIRTGLDTTIERIFLRTSPDGEQSMTEMHKAEVDAISQWWETDFKLTMPRTNYRFLLVTVTEGSWWLTALGVVRHTPIDATDFKILARHRAPKWVHQSVFYQIFPDRFADGDSSNNVTTGEYLSYGHPVVARKWGELPNPSMGSQEFFGGDIQGITQKLDYLQELGVTALYLNPIFTAPSSHKYDVADYRHVDPHFGGESALIELRQELDKRGMRLVLDIVPNHCGITHPWFTEAQRDPTAPTAEYFIFRQHPADYESWLGVRSLPKLNYRSVKLREEMYAGINSIMRYWLRPPFRIDGWRLDVANMLARQGESQLGHKIGRAVRKAVKEEMPEAYLLGEHFFDGTLHLQGDELDASMNYRGFSLPLLRWLAGFDTANARPWGDAVPLPTSALAAQWQVFLAAIPWQIANQQFNLLGSHDTARIFTIVGGNVALLKVAVTILFTYPGVPCIYYGDEVGLPGGRDPDCRRCMTWDSQDWNHEILDFYRQLIHLRRESEALAQGGFQILLATEHTMAYQRETPTERLIIVAKRQPDTVEQIPVLAGGLADGTHCQEIFSGATATIVNGQLAIGSFSGVDAGVQIWRAI
jgi:alpha-glucosidase